MSGRRCRALRRQFKELFGETPGKAERIDDRRYYVSLWRRVKAAYRNRTTPHKILEPFTVH